MSVAHAMTAPAPFAPALWSNRLADEMHFRIQGVIHGIPRCCVDEFVQDVLYRDRRPGQERGVAFNSGGSYVPCWRCLREGK